MIVVCYGKGLLHCPDPWATAAQKSDVDEGPSVEELGKSAIYQQKQEVAKLSSLEH